MNVKYKELSVIGKVWTLAQTLSAGITENKKAYILAAVRKLNELNNSIEIDASMAVNETIDSIVDHATALKENFLDLIESDTDFVDNEDIISQIWYNRLLLDSFKYKWKNNLLTEADEMELEEIYKTLKSIYVVELKEKRLSGKERADLFKINEEVENFKIKFDTLVRRGQAGITF